MDDMMNSFIKLINDKYMEGLREIENYLEFVLEFSDYTVEDIVRVDWDMGNSRMCEMVVCPKSCVIDGFGILKPDYFIGLEQVFDDNGLFLGWDIIFEVPEKLKIDNVEWL